MHFSSGCTLPPQVNVEHVPLQPKENLDLFGLDSRHAFRYALSRETMSEPKASLPKRSGPPPASESRDALIGLCLSIADFLYDDAHVHDDTYYSEDQVNRLASIRSLAEKLRMRRLHGEKRGK